MDLMDCTHRLPQGVVCFGTIDFLSDGRVYFYPQGTDSMQICLVDLQLVVAFLLAVSSLSAGTQQLFKSELCAGHDPWSLLGCKDEQTAALGIGCIDLSGPMFLVCIMSLLRSGHDCMHITWQCRKCLVQRCHDAVAGSLQRHKSVRASLLSTVVPSLEGKRNARISFHQDSLTYLPVQ